MKFFKTNINTLLLILFTALVLLIVINIQIIPTIVAAFMKIINPIIVGLAMAYVLNILIKKIEQLILPHPKNNMVFKAKRFTSILLAYAIIIGIFVLIINILLPQLAETFASISNLFPNFIERVRIWLISYQYLFPSIGDYINNYQIDWHAVIASLSSFATSGLGNIFSSSIATISTFASGIFDIIIAFALSIYLLLDKEKLQRQFHQIKKAYLTKAINIKIDETLNIFNHSFTNFITGQCLEAVILGSLCAIGLWIFRFPYVGTIGMVVGATALIPIVGAYVGAGIGVLLILIVNPIQALWFIVFILVLQQLENNLIYPKVVGTSIGLPGIWVLIGVVIGGGVAGVLGMLLGVPTSSALYLIIKQQTFKRLKVKEVI